MPKKNTLLFLSTAWLSKKKISSRTTYCFFADFAFGFCVVFFGSNNQEKLVLYDHSDFWKTIMFGSSLPPVVCMRAHFIFKLYVFVSALLYPTHIVLCCVFVLFFFVLCALYCKFLWIVHLWLPLRYSLTFIYKSSIVNMYNIYITMIVVFQS
jgi:hypothetical protein